MANVIIYIVAACLCEAGVLRIAEFFSCLCFLSVSRIMVLEKLKKFVEKLLKIVEKFEEGKVLYFGWSFSTVVLSLLGPVNRAKTIKDV